MELEEADRLGGTVETAAQVRPSDHLCPASARGLR